MDLQDFPQYLEIPVKNDWKQISATHKFNVDCF